MSQITLYLPDELIARLKRAAKKAGVSLSSHVSGILQKKTMPSSWPQAFLDLYGSTSLCEAADLPPEDVPDLEG